MVVVLWEYEVKRGSEKRLERVYGPGGGWDSRFLCESEHAGTYLLRDTTPPRV
jgi:hypothetical protein